jgi:Flp pilus assembly protein TadD
VKNLATILSARGNFPEAAYYFETALALNPENAGARCKFAITLSKLGRQAEAWRLAICRTKLIPDGEKISLDFCEGFL